MVDLSPPNQPQSFLDGRPGVPRLQLGRLFSGDHAGAAAAAAEAASSRADDASTAEAPPARPALPLLALSKLNPAAGASRKGVVQSSRIPAANFSAMDASLHRSPSKLQYSSSGYLTTTASASGTGSGVWEEEVQGLALRLADAAAAGCWQGVRSPPHKRAIHPPLALTHLPAPPGRRPRPSRSAGGAGFDAGLGPALAAHQHARGHRPGLLPPAGAAALGAAPAGRGLGGPAVVARAGHASLVG